MDSILTYIINLEKRQDRLQHILKEFSNKTEFNLHIFKAIYEENGKKGLIASVQGIIQDAIKQDVPYIIICEDDHAFTHQYDKINLLKDIIYFDQIGADILLGGVSWFQDAIEFKENFFWINKFSGFQFTVVFRSFFNKLLNEELLEKNVDLDLHLQILSDQIYTYHPFISIQKEFGYSDVTSKNGSSGFVDRLFLESDSRLSVLKMLNSTFQGRKS